MLLWIAVALACGGQANPETPLANRASAPASGDGVQYVGDPSAKVVLTYYFDYECLHCYTFAPTIDEIERNYGSRIVVYYKNFQLAMHPGARVAAIAAEAARRQGKFVEMHRLLMEHGKSTRLTEAQITAAIQGGGITMSPKFTRAGVRAFAARLGLDLARFDRDVADASSAARVDGEYAEGERRGVNFVPVVFIGDKRYDGAMEVSALSSTVDTQLGH